MTLIFFGTWHHSSCARAWISSLPVTELNLLCIHFADAVSSAAAVSAAVEAAEEAEYSIGHKAVTQLPESKTPARPRGTAAETEHPRCC